jgi:hypothetical protein
MLEEKNDNLSVQQNETDGNVENETQEVVQIVANEVEANEAVPSETIEEVENEVSEEAFEEITAEKINSFENERAEEVTTKTNDTIIANEKEFSEELTTEKSDAIAAIETENAAENEDETLKERHEIPLLDYDSLSMEELIAELEKLSEIEKIMSIKDHVDEIKNSFLAKYYHFFDEKKEEFKAENPESKEEFHYQFPLKSKFDQLYSAYRDKKNAHFKNLQNNLKNNLEVRLAIVEELKNLINPQENIKDTLKHFNELRERWKNAGAIPKDKYNHVWNNYHFHVENFYDYLHLDREARDLDFKHNLDLKLKIISRVEILVDEADINQAFRELQDLHKIWKEDIGPVSRDHREEIWNRFSELTKQMHDKRELLFEAQRGTEKENLDLKKEIIAQIEVLATEKVNAHSQWQSQIDKVEALRTAFFAAGKVPTEVNESTWSEFKTAVRNFNTFKNSFYKDIKKEQQDNLNKKMELVARAKALQSSEDFATATPLMKQIQEEWKLVGHVPRKYSDSIWAEFKTACNHYFEVLKAQKNEANSEEMESFEKKKAYLEQLREFQLIGEHKADLVAIKLHIENWKAFGKVPFARRHIEGKFNKILDALFEKLSLSKKETEMARFSNRVGNLSESNDTRKLENEKIFIMRKIDEVQNEIFQLENNIQFFTNTKNAKKENSIVLEVRKNIEIQKETLEVWKEKLKQIRSINVES